MDKPAASKCRTDLSASHAIPMPGSGQSRQDKSVAILGGMSALEMMRSEQVTFAQPIVEVKAADNAAMMGVALTLQPAIGNHAASQADCQAGEQTVRFARPGLNPLPSALPQATDYLLGKRVRIGRTRFDAQWQRVERGNISARHFQRAVGKRPASGAELLGQVNSWVNNNIAYVEDSRLWGTADYWATAAETLRRAGGDCEDLAIVKMKLLERAGIAAEDMFLTVARDRYRNADHAFLVVQIDGERFVLDNAVDRVLPANQDLGYQPVLSFSGSRNWLHGY